MDDQAKTQISDALKEIVSDLAPGSNLREMYGGLVIELEKDNPKSQIGGIFEYEKYVSLELSNGASFEDPGSVLEGSGKLRRHVKLRSLEDVETKSCKSFLQQAIATN